MTAFKIIGVILLVLLSLGFLRLGFTASFGDELRLRIRVGPLRFTVLPRKKRPGRKRKKPEEPTQSAEAPPKKRRSHPKPTLPELFELADAALTALNTLLHRSCSRVRIDPLDVTVVFGGRDPADTARLYAFANTAMFTLMPKAEECFYIPDPSLHLRVDFDRETIGARGKLGASLRLCDILAILFTVAVPLLRCFLRIRRAHRNDAPPRDEAEKTEDKIA